MSFLLDTCVVSEAARPNPEPRVAAWMDEHDASPMYLSVLSLGELFQGIARQTNALRAEALRSWVATKVMPRFEGRLLELDPAVARTWGELRGEAIAKGRTPPVIDSLLAATALVHGLRIVTRNTKDFESLGVELLNPWTD